MSLPSSSRQLYQHGVELLQHKGCPDADLDCRFFLSHLLQLSSAQLFVEDSRLSPEQVQAFSQFLRRRSQGEPLAYIIGEQEFWSLAFKVNQHVLIPRPETELLVQAVLTQCSEGPHFKGTVLDLGTGSGVLPVTLATELPQASFVALDLSMAALLVARQNSVRHQVEGRISFVQGWWASSIQPCGSFDYIVSNPPYVDPATFADLQHDVVGFEPLLALDGGLQGREVITSMVAGLSALLKPGGHLFMEIGYDQQRFIEELLQKDPLLTGIAVTTDYAGLPRLAQAQRLE